MAKTSEIRGKEAAINDGAPAKKGGAKNLAQSAETGERMPGRHAYVYLGPNLPGGLLFTGGVYKELPEHLHAVFTKAPEIKALFIEVGNAAAFKAGLRRQGSEAFRLWQTVETLVRKGGLSDGRV